MNNSIHTRVLASLVVVAASFSCSDGNTGGGETPVVIAQVTINATGGELAAPDGSIKLRVPAGAVQQDTSLTLETASAPSGSVGKAFSIKPAGVSFAVPVTVAISYNATELGTHRATDLQVANYVSGRWQPLAGRFVDQASSQVSGTTQSIAAEPYTKMFAQGNSSSKDAGLPPLGAGGSSTVSPGSGGTTGGGTCMPSGASAGSAPYPTCATATNICPSGMTIASCTDNATGYTAMCCGTQTPTTGGVTGSGGGSSTGGGCMPSGATAGSAPYPTCATATNVCPPTYTMTSCIDNATGYTATCCSGAGTGGFSGSGGMTGSGGTASGPDASACKPVADMTAVAPYPTCATTTICTTQPGLPVLTNCVQGATGITALCCP